MIELKNVGYTYQGKGNKNAVHDISLNINQGELVLLCGESGCGKTTLIRLINGLVPHYYEGKLTGEVLIDGETTKDTTLPKISKKVGSVFQNPRTQFFNVDTTSELAFGCENLAMPVDEIEKRIQTAVQEFKIDDLIGRSIFKLSGGEKQKIACASIAVSDTEIIVLDEPSSNLDIKAINELKEIISHWKKQGKTIIISEHRLFYLRELADKVVFMKNGKIETIYTGENFSKRTSTELSQLGLRVTNLNDVQINTTSITTESMMVFKNAVYSYAQKLSLNIPNVQIPMGKIVAIIGNNGAGKTTFARCLCGLLKEKKSVLEINSRSLNAKERVQASYMVMQDVNHQLFAQSVLDEVLLGFKTADETLALTFLQELDLIHLKDKHPMSLSGGEKQRLAVAGALSCEKELLIFDEPTSGLDLRHMKEVAKTLKKLKEKNKSIVLITHDLELIADCADHIIHIENGEVSNHYFLNNDGNEQLLKFFKSEN